MQLKNVAAVMVTAQLPAFAQPGQTIDINVSSVGNAKSLRGGTLIATPLKGADGQIYAMAQGNLIVGGAGAVGGRLQGADQPPERRPHPRRRDGRARGATPLSQGDSLQLDLNASDFATARAVASAINASKGAGIARRARRPRRSGCACRRVADARVDFLADIENLDVEPGRAGRQGRDQRAHRLGRDEPGGHARAPAPWRTAACR